MDRQFKKIFSILSAILVGLIIILFAWRSGVVVQATNTLGDNSWLSSLSVVPQADALKTVSASQSESIIGNATTTMGIVSLNLLAGYTLAQKDSTSAAAMSDSDAASIAQETIDKIDLPQSTQFSERDIITSRDNSRVAIESYLNEINRLVQAFNLSQTKNDIDVAFAVPKAGEEKSRTANIAQNIAHYEKLIKGLLAVKVPSNLAQYHLLFIQKWANIQATIEPMAGIFTDPLKGLAALSQYRGEVAEFDILGKEFADYISKKKQ